MIAAVEVLEGHTQARFNQLVLRLNLEQDIPSDTRLSVAKKCDLLGRILVERHGMLIATADGNMTLGEAVVREGVKLMRDDAPETQIVFARALARDGYVVMLPEEYGRQPWLRAALPEELQLPQTDNELHQLLKHFGFVTPLGHLDQAIDAHTRGDWAACNSQLRTFLESLYDEIACHVKPAEAPQLASSENRRRLLADIGFLSIARKEMSEDGKNYINGLFKMLHTEGSHPGLSDEDHSTFRLYVVLVTARAFLRRLYCESWTSDARTRAALSQRS